MTTFRDDRRYTDHETYKRDPGPDFSESALEAQKAAFLKSGGKVQSIATGVTAFNVSKALRPNSPASRGGKKGSAGRTGITERRALKTKLEESL